MPRKQSINQMTVMTYLWLKVTNLKFLPLASGSPERMQTASHT